MATYFQDLMILPLPDGSDLAVVIYQDQKNGYVHFQPAFYKQEQVLLFQAMIAELRATDPKFKGTVSRFSVPAEAFSPVNSH